VVRAAAHGLVASAFSAAVAKAAKLLADVSRSLIDSSAIPLWSLASVAPAITLTMAGWLTSALFTWYNWSAFQGSQEYLWNNESVKILNS